MVYNTLPFVSTQVFAGFPEVQIFDVSGTGISPAIGTQTTAKCRSFSLHMLAPLATDPLRASLCTESPRISARSYDDVTLAYTLSLFYSFTQLPSLAVPSYSLPTGQPILRRKGTYEVNLLLSVVSTRISLILLASLTSIHPTRSLLGQLNSTLLLLLALIHFDMHS